MATQAAALSDRIAEQEKRIARHAEQEAELKACKKIIKEIKERKEKLVEEARNKIDSAEARQNSFLRGGNERSTQRLKSTLPNTAGRSAQASKTSGRNIISHCTVF